MTFKKHDRVYWFWSGAGTIKKYFGYVQGTLRELFVIIDDMGNEWFMYDEELRMANQVSMNEIIKHIKK